MLMFQALAFGQNTAFHFLQRTQPLFVFCVYLASCGYLYNAKRMHDIDTEEKWHEKARDDMQKNLHV